MIWIIVSFCVISADNSIDINADDSEAGIIFPYLSSDFQLSYVQNFTLTYESLNKGEKDMVNKYLGDLPRTDSIIEAFSELTAISPMLGRKAAVISKIWTKNIQLSETKIFINQVLLSLIQTIVKKGMNNNIGQQLVDFYLLQERFHSLSHEAMDELKTNLPHITNHFMYT